jgi:hypothetical protein
MGFPDGMSPYWRAGFKAAEINGEKMAIMIRTRANDRPSVKQIKEIPHPLYEGDAVLRFTDREKNLWLKGTGIAARIRDNRACGLGRYFARD